MGDSNVQGASSLRISTAVTAKCAQRVIIQDTVDDLSKVV